VYDNLSEGHSEAVSGVPLVEGELADREGLVQALEQCHAEAVIHFAAHCSVAESVREPAKYYGNNVANTISLLDAMRAAGVARIVFSSSAATYGNPAYSPIDEEHPQEPCNPYGRTKLHVEGMLADYAEAYGMAAVALRYFNAAGASRRGDIGEDHAPETHLIPLVLQTALGQREHIAVYGTDYDTPDGTCVRDYVHVADLADAHIRAITHAEPGTFSAYNLGNGQGYSVREVIDTARAVTGHTIASVDAARRPGDPPVLVASSDKIVRELGWSPELPSLNEIISTAWRWHSDHPQGYGS